MNYVIWKSKIDKKFDVIVERVAPYEGELVIMEDDKKLTSTSVTISYDAKFGPDLEDVRIWENFCINFIDNNYN